MKPGIFEKVSELLSNQERIVLARIIKRTGAAPRDVGAKCIIREDGSVVGTIGGGSLEYAAVECAAFVYKHGISKGYHFNLNSGDITITDMACGGTVEVYLEPIFPDNQETVGFFASLNESAKCNLTLIAEGTAALSTQTRMLKEKTQSKNKIRGLNEETIALNGLREPTIVTVPDSDIRIFAEPFDIDPVVYLFGAGHVSTYVAPLASTVGFQVTVIDDRKEFANRARFPDADDILVVNFAEIFDHIAINGSSYIVIVTRGHAHDRLVLESALRTDPAYIGMIGSRKKRELIYKALRENGISDEKIASVYSSIGIDIHAETPEEIAVSIVSELIKVRAEINR